MKITLNRFSLIVALLICSGSLLRAQMPGKNASPMNAAMLKLFGKNTNFTANAEVRMLDKSQKEMMSATFPIATLGDKMRSEMDMAQMKSAMLSPQVLAQMKQMGADKTISVVRPDLGATYLIYPSLKSYVQMPMSEADKAALTKEPKIEKTELGKETIDGHPTVKNKIVVKSDQGTEVQATVWSATDLKDFPIQIQTQEDDGTVLMKFKDVKFTKPDAKQFELPKDYTKYDNMRGLQQMMMQKMMGSLPKN